VRVTIIRPPYTSAYNMTDVREDAIVSFALGYLACFPEVEADAADFHLDRSLTLDGLMESRFDAIVIAVRETGNNFFYSLRIAKEIGARSTVPLILYGQTGRLSAMSGLPRSASIVPHDETQLARALNLPTSGPRFEADLRVHPYMDAIKLSPAMHRRRKASLETSRGCHFRCGFCFINHGENYPQRWTLRPIERIIDDVHEYQNRDISSVVFHDSELIGADSSNYPRHKQLFQTLAAEAPKLQFMMYARADSIARFGELDLLQKSGLVHIFIGVESLSDSDLRVLRKGQRSEEMVKIIETIRDRGIYMNLSFMIFNRGTTLTSLRENVNKLKQLSARNVRQLGMPNFLFSFEAAWTSNEQREKSNTLSQTTYLRWLVHMRSQPTTQVAFNPMFEPMMEICRLIHYELACKISEANLARDDATDLDFIQIEAWFAEIWPFSISVLEYSIERFEQGRMSLSDLGERIEEAYEMVRNYYLKLPVRLRLLATYENHAKSIVSGASIPLEDHGWDTAIPARATA
jgi:hypothetical protein